MTKAFDATPENLRELAARKRRVIMGDSVAEINGALEAAAAELDRIKNPPTRYATAEDIAVETAAPAFDPLEVALREQLTELAEDLETARAERDDAVLERDKARSKSSELSVAAARVDSELRARIAELEAKVVDVAVGADLAAARAERVLAAARAERDAALAELNELCVTVAKADAELETLKKKNIVLEVQAAAHDLGAVAVVIPNGENAVAVETRIADLEAQVVELERQRDALQVERDRWRTAASKPVFTPRSSGGVDAPATPEDVMTASALEQRVASLEQRADAAGRSLADALRLLGEVRSQLKTALDEQKQAGAPPA